MQISQLRNPSQYQDAADPAGASGGAEDALSRREANAAYAEAVQQRTGQRVRRREDDSEACERCWSDVADYLCDMCGKYVCSGCSGMHSDGGRYCANCVPAKTGDAA